MGRPVPLAEQICERARDLSPESLLELARFVDYLYFKAKSPDALEERLARDYEELALMYEELKEELADEVWLPLENESLLATEADDES